MPLFDDTWPHFVQELKRDFYAVDFCLRLESLFWQFLFHVAVVGVYFFVQVRIQQICAVQDLDTITYIYPSPAISLGLLMLLSMIYEKEQISLSKCMLLCSSTKLAVKISNQTDLILLAGVMNVQVKTINQHSLNCNKRSNKPGLWHCHWTGLTEMCSLKEGLFPCKNISLFPLVRLYLFFSMPCWRLYLCAFVSLTQPSQSVEGQLWWYCRQLYCRQL